MAAAHDISSSQPLDSALKAQLAEGAKIIRGLAMDGVQKANSGHPGLPMGCAEIGSYLFGHALRHSPTSPHWHNRDRFILSAGHGSMLLYSCLHLAGFDVTMADLQAFRQLHSRTPGHPESTLTPGVETTTGPLGQGVGHAVGQALGLKLLAARFNKEGYPLFDSKVFCLMGDGCAMEGVSSEVSSLAGHLQLDNLVLIYDANAISLDGPLSESCSEDTAMRYRAYGWDVYTVDGHDLDALHKTFSYIRENQEAPALVIASTTIGKGAPHKQGSHHAHGSPLGPDEVKATKEALGLPQTPFYLPEEVHTFFKEQGRRGAAAEVAWNGLFEKWSRIYPEERRTFDAMASRHLPEDLEGQLNALSWPASVAGRKASQMTLEFLGTLLPQLYGGSADLSCSDLTMMKAFPLVTSQSFVGRNIKYGVREFGMATIATGLSQTQMITPFVGTFLTFSDYMRNAIRLSALMKQQLIYQFTHDSIFLGEDGPTHQPVEHYAALRAIPHLHFIRPADAHEVAGAWIAALRYDGPTAIALSRQELPTLAETERPFADSVGRGGYILVGEEGGPPDYTLFATGSEVHLALAVRQALIAQGKRVRVISMPCWELFEKQPADYQDALIGGTLGKRVSIEAGIALGWHRYIGSDGIAIALSDFGASAPAKALTDTFGFTVKAIMARIV